MRRSVLMLLDEPTNHLDLDAVLWLQGWLITYPGTLLVISHDREFIDAVTTHTLHLHGGTAPLYTRPGPPPPLPLLGAPAPLHTGNPAQSGPRRAERGTWEPPGHAKQQRQ